VCGCGCVGMGILNIGLYNAIWLNPGVPVIQL